MPADEIRTAAETVFRQESGRILAGLIRLSGSFDRAEEAMQEAFASALAAWPDKGIPQNPAAWITAAAHRKLIDAVRRDRTKRDGEPVVRHLIESASLPAEDDEAAAMNFPDDRLRLMFTCCHPALNREVQIALTLRTLGGLSTPEIAKAFLIPEATLAQRIVRAKQKIQQARIPYEVPPPERIGERLEPVQAVIYLIFNEGYAASSGSGLFREDLCAEAIRLARVLCQLMPQEPENLALLALLLLQDSRRNARLVDGALVTLEEQDRTRWDRAAIAEGLELVEKSLRWGGPVGPYQLQAAIAALHSQAATPGETDWNQIAALYEMLRQSNPASPVLALNHAAAIAMAGDLAGGLDRMNALAAELDHYYLFHAAKADLFRRQGNCREQAIESYRRAAQLATNPVEIAFLRRRIAELTDS